MYRKVTPLTALVIALILGGCATTPDVMTYYPEDAAADSFRVWPPAPEVARYSFAGELRGEKNFGPSEQNQAGTGERVFRWLVGLGSIFRGRARELVRPHGGVTDANGRTYVTDVGRSAVFVFDEAQGKLHIWEQAEEFTNFISPIGIALGRPGEILVTDSVLARVVRLDYEGNPVGSFGVGELGRPTGLARDPAKGEVYVADTQNHDIKVFDDNGTPLRRIGARGDGPGRFNAPTHLAFAGGRLYVSDTLNARVQILEPDGTAVRSVGRRGLYVGNLTRPKGVTTDSEGNLYIVEGYYDHMLIFGRQGEFLLPIGGTGVDIGQFYLPAGIWRDQRNRIFVADMFNARVIIFQYLGA